MLVNTNVSKGYALPPTLLDEPACRYLRQAFLTRKGRHLVSLATNEGKGICVDCRILKEASRVTDRRRIRELAIPDGYHRLAYIPHPGRRDAVACKGFLESTVRYVDDMVPSGQS